MCVCNWPPFSEVCPNYEVVMFQPWTVTPPCLGYVAIVTYIISSHPSPSVSTFSGYLFSLLNPTAPPSASVHRHSPLSVLHPIPNSSSGAKCRPPGCYPPPTTCQPLLIVSAPRAACLCLSPFPIIVPVPLFCPWTAPRYLSPPVGVARRVSLCLPCAPLFPSLTVC